jgi:hypothetical protein
MRKWLNGNELHGSRLEYCRLQVAELPKLSSSTNDKDTPTTTKQRKD